MNRVARNLNGKERAVSEG